MAVTKDQSWGLLLSFANLDYGESPEHAFVHGFEVGGLWARMKSGASEIEMTVHAVNRVVIERAAAADGWTVEFAPSLADDIAVDGYLNVTLTKVVAAKPNPHGLRVVAARAPGPK